MLQETWCPRKPCRTAKSPSAGDWTVCNPQLSTEIPFHKFHNTVRWHRSRWGQLPRLWDVDKAQSGSEVLPSEYVQEWKEFEDVPGLISRSCGRSNQCKLSQFVWSSIRKEWRLIGLGLQMNRVWWKTVKGAWAFSTIQVSAEPPGVVFAEPWGCLCCDMFFLEPGAFDWALRVLQCSAFLFTGTVSAPIAFSHANAADALWRLWQLPTKHHPKRIRSMVATLVPSPQALSLADGDFCRNGQWHMVGSQHLLTFMCVYMYVFIWFYLYTYLYIVIHINVGLSVCLYVCLSVCMSVRLYVCTSVCQYVCLSVWHGMALAWHGIGMAWHWHGRHGIIWHGMVWYDMIVYIYTHKYTIHNPHIPIDDV